MVDKIPGQKNKPLMYKMQVGKTLYVKRGFVTAFGLPATEDESLDVRVVGAEEFDAIKRQRVAKFTKQEAERISKTKTTKHNQGAYTPLTEPYKPKSPLLQYLHDVRTKTPISKERKAKWLFGFANLLNPDFTEESIRRATDEHYKQFTLGGLDTFSTHQISGIRNVGSSSTSFHEQLIESGFKEFDLHSRGPEIQKLLDSGIIPAEVEHNAEVLMKLNSESFLELPEMYKQQIRSFVDIKLRSMTGSATELAGEASTIDQEIRILESRLNVERSDMAKKQIKRQIRDRKARLSEIRYGVSGYRGEKGMPRISGKVAPNGLKGMRGDIQRLAHLGAAIEGVRVDDIGIAKGFEIDSFFDDIEKIHTTNPELGLALERYRSEVAAIRSGESSAQKIYNIQRMVGLDPIIARSGELRGTFLDVVGFGEFTPEEFGDFRSTRTGHTSVIGEMRSGSGERISELGVVVKPRSLLGDTERAISHKPLGRLDVLNGDLDVRPFSSVLYESITGDKDDPLYKHVENVALRIQQETTSQIEMIAERIGFDSSSEDGRRVLSTARSLYLGTIYEAESSGLSNRTPDLSDAIPSLSDKESISHRNIIKRILVEDGEFSSNVKRILFNLSPDLRSLVDKQGELTTGGEITKALQGEGINRRSGVSIIREAKRAMAEAKRSKIHEISMNTSIIPGGGEESITIEDLLSNTWDGDSSDGGFDEGISRRVGFENNIRVAFNDPEFSDLLFDGVYKDSISNVQDYLLDVLYDAEDDPKKLIKRYKYFAQKPYFAKPALKRAYNLTPRDVALIHSQLSYEELRALGLGVRDAEVFAQFTQIVNESAKITPEETMKARMALYSKVEYTDRQAQIAMEVAESLRNQRDFDARKMLWSGDKTKRETQIMEMFMNTTKSVVDPFFSLRPYSEILSTIQSDMESGTIFSIGGGDDTIKATIADIFDPSGDGSTLGIRYRLYGGVERNEKALRAAGFSSDEILALGQNSDYAFVEHYRYESFDDTLNDIFDSQLFNINNWKKEKERLRKQVIGRFPKLTQAQVDSLVESEVAIRSQGTSTGGDYILKGTKGKISGFGGLMRVEAPEQIVPVQSNGFFFETVRKVGGRNTVSSDRASFAAGLYDRIYGIASNKKWDKASAALANESIFKMRDGKVVLNPKIIPHVQLSTGGFAPMEISSDVQGVIDQIVSGLGGNDEVARMIRETELGAIKIDGAEVLHDVFSFGDTPGSSIVQSGRTIRGPLALGNVVETFQGVDAATLNDAISSLDMGEFPSTVRSSRGTVGKLFVEALQNKEMGDLAPRSDQSDILIDAINRHSSNLHDERMMEQYSPEVREAISGAKNSRASANMATGEVVVGSGQKRVTKAAIQEVWDNHKSLRWGTGIAAGFAAWGIYRGRRSKQDHSFDDMSGPPNLPGGSAYGNKPQGFTNYRTGGYARQNIGMTYMVDASGQFDADAMLGEMGSHVGGSTVLNRRNISNNFHSNPRGLEELSRGYG